MSNGEELLNQLNQVMDGLREESHALGDRQAQTRQRLRVTVRLRKALMDAALKEPTPKSFSPLSEAEGRKAWIAWLIEMNAEIKGLLQKPGARTLLNQLLAHEPPLTYGKVIDDLEQL